jgi:hypothetical protein
MFSKREQGEKAPGDTQRDLQVTALLAFPGQWRGSKKSCSSGLPLNFILGDFLKRYFTFTQSSPSL